MKNITSWFWAFFWPENTYIALDNDKVIGFVCCFEKIDNSNIGEINSIYILSEYYGTGVAQKLMDAGLEMLKDYSQKELWLMSLNG